MSGTDDAGNPIEYPPFRRWNEKAFDQILDRLKSTNNKYLKIRYAMLLWHSEHKHRDYANIAIENYIDLFHEFGEIVKTSEDRQARETFESIYYNLIPLAISINHTDLQKIKEKYLELILNIDVSGKNKFLVSSMIYTMLDYPKLFKQVDLIAIKPIVEKIYSNLVSEHDKIRLSELAIKLEQKTNGKKEAWLRNIGESYEALSFQREDDTKLAAFTFCQEALSIFKELKDEEKIKELSERYDYLKKNMKLGKFSQKIDVTEIVIQNKSKADELTNSSSEEIFNYISNSAEIIPKYDTLETEAKARLKKGGIELIASKSIIDDSGHIAETFNSEEEKIKSIMIESADYQIKFDLDILIQEICYQGIQKTKITSDSLKKTL